MDGRGLEGTQPRTEAAALRPVASMFLETGVIGTLSRFAFDTALMLVVLFLSYRLLHRGLRFRLIERLMVLTSLTHFGFIGPGRRRAVPDRLPIADLTSTCERGTRAETALMLPSH